jgi:hypothetical protein
MDNPTTFDVFIVPHGGLGEVRVLYRVRQFWHALIPMPDMEDLAHARQVLSPPLLALFLNLQTGEQAHSLWMFRQLIMQGETNRDLWTAALLHDVGKSCYPLRLWERIMIVLVKAMFPSQVKDWSLGNPSGWKRPLVIAEQHPAWGAELAKQAGASSLAVSLIQRHHEFNNNALAGEEDRLLQILQRLDEEIEVNK